jgi:hypothetical protein
MALYSFGELSAMSVKGLRALVRKHNLHVALKGYSKMRKTPLIHAFLAKKPAKPTAATAGPSPNPPPAPKKKQAVARVASRTTAVEPSAPKKNRRCPGLLLRRIPQDRHEDLRGTKSTE